MHTTLACEHKMKLSLWAASLIDSSGSNWDALEKSYSIWLHEDLISFLFTLVVLPYFC